MKAFITIIFFLLSFFAKATNYYFSSSGNDANTGTILSPWKTITKFNSIFASRLPGDSLLFKRGETFFGAITISRSGTALNPIVIGAYGTGNRPKIIGLVTMSGFTQSGNIWTSAANSLLTSDTKVVLDDGVQLSVGRYPNLNTSNKGYLMYESATANSITDNQLSTTPINWTGATVAYRWSTYHIKKAVVASHANTRLTFVSSSMPVSTVAGYFFTNDIRTLDQNGEYYINNSTKQISIYSNAGAPTGIQASAIPYLIKSLNFSYITITDLNLIGANNYAVSIGPSSGSGGSDFTVKNCDINYSGEGGIYINNHSNLIVRDNSISNSLDAGIRLNNSPNFKITRNNISNSYTIAGMGGENLNGGGIYIPVSNFKGIIDSNRIVNNGLDGIHFDGDSIKVKYNLIDGYCLIKNDGGGIYTVPPKPTGTVQRHGQEIVGNIILNGGDATAGTTFVPPQTLAYGLFIDDASSNILIKDNSSSGGETGILLHMGINNIIRDNTFYNFEKGLYIRSEVTNAAAASPSGGIAEIVRGLTIKNNIFFATRSTDRPIYIYAVNNDARLFGTFDSNYICRPSFEPNNINNAGTNASGGTINVYTGVNSFYSLIGGWQIAYSPYDAHSKKSPKGNDVLRFEANSSYRDSVVILSYGNRDYTWLDAKGVRVKGTLTLAPYTSVILIRDTIVPIATIPNVPPTVSLTSPANGSSYTAPATIPLTATAADADGTVSVVRFYNGSSLLGSDNSSPYSLTLINVPAGGYSFTAHAIDNSGDSTISAARTATVSNPPPPNIAPTISITSPANGATYTSPASILITASASDVDGTITQVQFYNGATLLSTDLTSPYTYSWTGVTAGTYSITAKATDDDGAITTSGAVSVAVQTAPPVNVPPTISVTSPIDGESYGEPATVYITADAADADGTVTQVEFFNGATLLATDVDSPYVYTWSPVAAGNYNITAKATDNSSATTTSSVIGITVIANLPPTVSITSPADNSSFSTPADITINADASDADGNITVVNFYEGSAWIGSDSSAPYTFNVSGYTTGNYTFFATATDNSGDSTVSSGINVTVNPAAPLAINIEVEPILCNGGTTTITTGATGGTAPYTGTGSSVVGPGTYTRIVIDNLGAQDTAIITIANPTAISLTDSLGTISVYAGSTIAVVYASGGAGNYQFQINGGQWQSSGTFAVPAGNYVVNVKDANNCTSSISFSITQPVSTGILNMQIKRVGEHINVNR